MHAEIVERDDLSVYVIAGVPRSFKTRLRDFVRKEAKEAGDVIQLDGEMTEWVVAQLRDEKRPSKTRTPASRALWRAFSALSAARYHLMNQNETEERILELRRKVEELWREVSPMFEDASGDEPDDESEVESAAEPAEETAG